MSNEIIRSGKYEPSHMSNFLDALKYYGKSRNNRKDGSKDVDYRI